MGVCVQRHSPAALPPGKTRYTLYRRLGRPQGRSGQVRKISPPTGTNLQIKYNYNYILHIFINQHIRKNALETFVTMT